MIKNYYLSLILLCCAFGFGYGQVTVYSESMGNTGANGTTIAVHEINNAFDEVALTYSGTGDLRDNTFSIGYPTASGSRNIMLNNAGETFVMDGIDITAYTGATLSFGIRKGTVAEDGSGFIIEYSTSGSGGPYTSLTFLALPTGAGTTIWYYRTTSIIPNNATTIRFRSNNTVQWRLDDLLLESINSNTSIEFTSTSASIAENGTFIDICVGITNASATNATTVEVVLDPGSTATNGADYENGVGTAIVFPATLTFPANTTGNQCISIFMSDDVLIEGNETVVLNLANPNGGNAATLGTDTQHVLTIVDDDAPAFADVIITEIMYNSSGTDDEWIEICNVSGSTQVLNAYTIEVGGTTEFTFPSTGVLIADGSCITIALGDNGTAPFNPDCPFTADYTNGLGTGTLNNTTDSITLVASDGSTVIDTVTYNSADGGNTTSLHVADTSLDNSSTGSNWQDVINGGSPGTNSLISPCTPPGPEINVEGAIGFFPDIANGDITPEFFDGTNFGASDIGNPITNTFRIENFGGTTDLVIASVTVIAGDVGDFSITTLPASPILALASSNFEIEFNPIAIGGRTAVIQIISNDADENPYTFTVTGEGLCVASPITAQPNSGPVGTIVSVSGTNLGTATASFNGIAASTTIISTTEIEVIVPVGANSGNLEILDSLGCPGSTPFNVISSEISTCEGSGGTTPTNLFISEVTDASTGGLTYVEIYNGTALNINLGTYSIQFFNNGSATQNGGNIALNPVNLAPGGLYVVAVSTGSNCTGITGADGSLADQTGFGGINFGANRDDHIRLYNNTTHIDSWGTYSSNVWADPLGIGAQGVVFRRNSAAAVLPNTIFNLADWTVVDWTSCSENDYSNIGVIDFSTGVPPSVTSISSLSTSCNEIILSVTATEGFPGSNPLQYVWFAYDPAQAGLGWQQIANGGIYTTAANSPDLIISDADSVADFQFYCEVREDDATCYSASNAIQVTTRTATWFGGTWNWNDGTALGTVPDLTTFPATVILEDDYDTGTQTSFSACNLIVNPTFELRVSNSNFIEIQNNVTVETGADIIVDTQGAFIQRGIGAAAGTFVLNGTASSQVNKLTAPLANWYNYTYWSSPVSNADVDIALASANANRRFYFNANNYNSSIVPDIDDEGDDWTLATGTGTMIPGRGYAATHTQFGFMAGTQYQYSFVGAFNTGDISYPVAYNPANTDHWNLLGNPYPSAIQVDGVDGFLNRNSGFINPAVYLWSHSSPPLLANPGNEVLNFNMSDYAIINNTMSIPGSSGITPGNYIPSGQSFFVSTIQPGSVTFTNAMRLSGNNSNDIFFRGAFEHDAFNTNDSEERLWITLSTEEGIFSQLGVGYIENATDAFDGLGYDAKRNFSSGYPTFIYSRIPNEDFNLAIQGKAITSLNENEIIPLGFKTNLTESYIYAFSIAQLEGDFLNSSPIYLKDNLLNILHNLKQAAYTFSATAGQFNDRFEIVFRENALSVDDNQLDENELSIIEQANGSVTFKVTDRFSIAQVEILDLLGRTVYRLKGQGAVEVYDLSQLSKATYIAKVTLSNGQTITKKAIKQR